MTDTPVPLPPADPRLPRIIDMPPEVLKEIFDEFIDCRLDDPSRIDWMDFREDDEIATKRDALKNARLTCRTLCEAVFLYLIPIVEARLEQEPLDRLEPFPGARFLPAESVPSRSYYAIFPAPPISTEKRS